ncbi:MAG: glycoside hydrolase family 88 protein, partial [Hungatella sp.]
MSWSEEALEKSLQKIERNITEIGEHFPHVVYEGKYNDQGAAFWTSGFWPGLLWLLYQEKKNEKALKLAGNLEEKLDEVLDGFVTLHHDVGFMWLPSAVIDYKLTGNAPSRIRGLKAASHLAGRFNLAGQFIRAWTDEVNPHSQGWAIIDCMMNLPLLFWASKELNDPRFYHIAKAHADTVLRSFIRPDNTTAHIVSFQPYTGEKIEDLGGQGKGPDSAWSRGQA